MPSCCWGGWSHCSLSGGGADSPSRLPRRLWLRSGRGQRAVWAAVWLELDRGGTVCKTVGQRCRVFPGIAGDSSSRPVGDNLLSSEREIGPNVAVDTVLTLTADAPPGWCGPRGGRLRRVRPRRGLRHLRPSGAVPRGCCRQTRGPRRCEGTAGWETSALSGHRTVRGACPLSSSVIVPYTNDLCFSSRLRFVFRCILWLCGTYAGCLFNSQLNLPSKGCTSSPHGLPRPLLSSLSYHPQLSFLPPFFSPQIRVTNIVFSIQFA